MDNDITMREIRLHDNKGNVKAVSVIDDCDAELLSYKWSLTNSGYARCSHLGLMHRVILGVTDRLVPVDHINGNRLDNQRCNLRSVTVRQNNMNKRKKAEASSQFFGVTWLSARNKWGAFIHVDCKRFSLGCYSTEIAAAQQYNHYVTQHGLGNRLNDVQIPADIQPFRPPQRRPHDESGITVLKSGFAADLRRVGIKRREVFATREEAVAARAKWCHEFSQEKERTRESRWQLDGDIARVKINKTIVIVDAADVKNLFKFCWRITPDGYVAADATGSMHRYLMKARPLDVVDHINNVRCDNRRSNLRIVDFSINNHNRVLQSGGVRKHVSGKFYGAITRLKKVYHTPLVCTFEEALSDRNVLARKLYGEHAREHHLDQEIGTSGGGGGRNTGLNQ